MQGEHREAVVRELTKPESSGRDEAARPCSLHGVQFCEDM
jgi:hypothetical protein